MSTLKIHTFLYWNPSLFRASTWLEMSRVWPVWGESSAQWVWEVITAGEWWSRCEGLAWRRELRASSSLLLLLLLLLVQCPRASCHAPEASVQHLWARFHPASWLKVSIRCSTESAAPGQLGSWENTPVDLLTFPTSTASLTLKASSAGERTMRCLDVPWPGANLTATPTPCQSHMQPEAEKSAWPGSENNTMSFKRNTQTLFWCLDGSEWILTTERVQPIEWPTQTHTHIYIYGLRPSAFSIYVLFFSPLHLSSSVRLDGGRLTFSGFSRVICLGSSPRLWLGHSRTFRVVYKPLLLCT